MSDNESDQNCRNEVEAVFETILVISESEFAKKTEIINDEVLNPHGPVVGCRKTLGDEYGKNTTEVVHIAKY